ncbi:unnamed protein product [Peniophora sp. CBMAI 1063]|nr:unnamed protein product [Peniophora sp. CBMAI 1063]
MFAVPSPHLPTLQVLRGETPHRSQTHKCHYGFKPHLPPITSSPRLQSPPAGPLPSISEQALQPPRASLLDGATASPNLRPRRQPLFVPLLGSESDTAIDSIEDLERFQASIRYSNRVLDEITAFLGTLMKHSNNTYEWAHLAGDEWDGHDMRKIIVGFLHDLRGRENERGTKLAKAGEISRAHIYWDAAQGIAQMICFVEQGMQVLHTQMLDHDLILMGNRSPYVYSPKWRP